MEYQETRRGRAGSSSQRVQMMPALCVPGLGSGRGGHGRLSQYRHDAGSMNSREVAASIAPSIVSARVRETQSLVTRH
jgi:hypothetical protein